MKMEPCPEDDLLRLTAIQRNNGRRTSSSRTLRELKPPNRTTRLVLSRNNGRVVEPLAYLGEALPHLIVNVMIMPAQPNTLTLLDLSSG